MRASIIELRVLSQIRLIGPSLHLFALLTKQGPRKVAKSRDRRSSTTYTELPNVRCRRAMQNRALPIVNSTTSPEIRSDHTIKLE